MSVLNHLACALGRRDEVPNVELAEALAARPDRKQITALVQALRDGSRAEQSDCVKVLYELGMRKPAAIAEHAATFGELLSSSHGRLVWGAMIALDAIATEAPAEVAKRLPAILAAADGASVIARDHAVGILIQLCGHSAYAKKCRGELIRILQTCPDNQLPMYVERSGELLAKWNDESVVSALRRRCGKLPKRSQQLRVEKVLKRLSAKAVR